MGLFPVCQKTWEIRWSLLCFGFHFALVTGWFANPKALFWTGRCTLMHFLSQWSFFSSSLDFDGSLVATSLLRKRAGCIACLLKFKSERAFLGIFKGLETMTSTSNWTSNGERQQALRRQLSPPQAHEMKVIQFEYWKKVEQRLQSLSFQHMQSTNAGSYTVEGIEMLSAF